MKGLKLVVTIILGIIMILGGFAHVLDPDLSSGLIPEFLPKYSVHIGTAIVEFALGISVFIPRYRKYGLYGIFFLMIGFLPLHVIDLFRENPVVGTQTVALVRVLMQLLLIYLPWFATRPK